MAEKRLTDEQMMLLMAHADDELDTAEERAQVEALLAEYEQARAIVGGFGATGQAMRVGVMDAPLQLDLTDVTARTEEQTLAVQLMAFADGELSDAQTATADIDSVLASSDAARNWVHDLKLAKNALHGEIMRDNTTADLSMIRGRVMRKLPVQARAPVPARAKMFPALSAWLADLGFGKTVMATGLVAAALLVAIGLRQFGGDEAVHVERPQMTAGSHGDSAVPSAVTAPADGEPEVIIEEMESDGGTVIFEGGEKPGEAVIIWHIEAGEGAG